MGARYGKERSMKIRYFLLFLLLCSEAYAVHVIVYKTTPNKEDPELFIITSYDPNLDNFSGFYTALKRIKTTPPQEILYSLEINRTSAQAVAYHHLLNFQVSEEHKKIKQKRIEMEERKRKRNALRLGVYAIQEEDEKAEINP